jgi:hypothetical protein
MTPVVAATLLPPAESTFVDQNGVPYAGGFVSFYVPSTSTPKDTWKDAAQTQLNTNPIVLDSAGRAIIYGSGCYTEILQDSLLNTIWNQFTCDTAAGGINFAGVSTGTANSQSISVPNFSNQDGQVIQLRVGFTNTGPLTLSVNGTTIGVLKDLPQGPVFLTGYEWIVGNMVSLIYDASRGALHMQALPPQPGSSANIASAATTDIGTVASHYAKVTGTTTITSFGSSCSNTQPIYFVQFAGILTLTNSAALALPGGGNIITVANDSAIASCLGSGNWQVLAYFPANAGNVPKGAVMAFNLAACPGGWSLMDGTSGTVDMRGQFVRGLNTSGSGTDPSRVLASLQADQLQDHVHNYNSGTAAQAAAGGAVAAGLAGASTTIPTSGNHGTETRPTNYAFLYCQKK